MSVKPYVHGVYKGPRDRHNKLQTPISIQLDGFDKIFAPGVSTVRRILWFVLITILCTFSAFQIYNSIHHLHHQHTAVTVSFINTATIKSPCITICPLILTKNVKLISKFWNQSNNTSIPHNDLYNLVSSTTTVEHIWNISDMIVEDLSLEVIEGISLVDDWIIDKFALASEKVNGLSGKCTAIHSKRDIVYNGLYTFIRIRNVAKLSYNDGTFLQVSIHSENTNHIDQLIVSKQGVIIPLHAQVNLYYSLQEHNLLNTNEKPCSNDEVVSECIDKCVHRLVYIVEKAECRLPFMDSDTGLPLCSTPDDFRRTFEIADKFMRNYSVEYCNCPRRCHSIVYNLKSVSELHVGKDYVLNLNILFSDNSIQQIIEYVAYDVTAFLSDVGGTLGLYLGICLINVIEIIEVIGAKLAAALNFKMKM